MCCYRRNVGLKKCPEKTGFLVLEWKHGNYGNFLLLFGAVSMHILQAKKLAHQIESCKSLSYHG